MQGMLRQSKQAAYMHARILQEVAFSTFQFLVGMFP